MFKQETYNLEFKESISKTFLKTVSAFANYNDGKIVFGMTDKGSVKGLSSVKETMLKIEHLINTSLDPRLVYRLKQEDVEGQTLIILEVFRGLDTPYYYNGKAYKRSDTSSVPVDRQELNRLVLAGMNLDYESNKSPVQDLEFEVLAKKMKEVLGIESLSLDILKTLGLYGKDGVYNIAALLLSDRNEAGPSGINMVKFGDTINVILFKDEIEGVSILTQFDYAVEIFERYYRYEKVEEFKREEVWRIPKAAFREAIANALVHREWDVNAHIQVAMYEDRVEIQSPGGLPFGMTEENYLREQLSVLRNPIIAGVFNRLRLIEKFGTGVLRIMKEYRDSYAKPKFDVYDDMIKVILPIYRASLPDLSPDERLVYELIRDHKATHRKDIDEETNFDKSKSLRAINNLLGKGLIIKEGSGPGTFYRLNS